MRVMLGAGELSRDRWKKGRREYDQRGGELGNFREV